MCKRKGSQRSHLPKYFEVRWTELTAGLIDATLTSWRPLILFAKDQAGIRQKVSGKTT